MSHDTSIYLTKREHRHKMYYSNFFPFFKWFNFSLIHFNRSNEETKKYLPEAISCPDFQTALMQVLTNESKIFLRQNAHPELMQIIGHDYHELDADKLKSLYIQKRCVAPAKLDKEGAQKLLKTFQVRLCIFS